VREREEQEKEEKKEKINTRGPLSALSLIKIFFSVFFFTLVCSSVGFPQNDFFVAAEKFK